MTADEIEKKYAELELKPGGFRNDRTKPLMELAKAAEKLGKADQADHLKTEAAAFYLTPRGKTFPGYFQPAIVYVDGSTSPARDYFTVERLAWMAKRARETASCVHGAHLADVCWDFALKKDPELARLAFDKYLECANQYWAAGAGLDFGEALKRAAELASSIKDAVRLARLNPIIRARAEDLDKRKEFRYCLDLADALENSRQTPPNDEEQLLILKILNNGATYYREAHPKRDGSFGPTNAPNEHMSRSFTDAQLRLSKAWKRTEITAETAKLELAQSYEREAEKAGNHLARLVFLRDAEKLYGELGKAAEQSRTRVAMAKAGKGAESEMKLFRGEFQIPHAEIDEYIKPLIGASLSVSLSQLAAAPHFIPDLNETKESAAKRKKEFPFQAIVPRVILKDGHLVGSASSEEELLATTTVRDFVMGIKIGGVFRSRLFERLTKEQGLSKDGLLVPFREWGYCKEKHLEFLGVGFDHYLKGDYVSSIHVLIPQFEDVLRGFLERSGQPISDPQRGKFIILDSLLKDPVLALAAGENLITWYKLSLSDPAGMNLRNDVAHGLSSPEVMTKETAELVIHILLSMTSFELEENKAHEQKP